MSEQGTLSSAAEVYVTDPVCRAAVERLVAREGLSFEDAARRAAATVKPAPHNIAADNARLLLAPDAVLAEQEETDRNLDQELGSPVPVDEFDQEAQHEAVARRRAEENEGSGPIPPHPDEAPDDRQVFAQTASVSQSDYDWVCQGGPHDECGALCELNRRLRNLVLDAGRIPLQPPALSLKRGRLRGYKASLTMETVPARGRAFTIGLVRGTPEEIDAGIQEILVDLESFPTERLVVRHRDSQPYATVVIYRPHQSEPVGYMAEITRDDAREMLRMFFGDSGPDQGISDPVLVLDVLPSGVIAVQALDSLTENGDVT